MMYLYSDISELKKLIESKSSIKEIESKTDEVIKYCDRLLKEHGKKSDIAKRIKMIESDSKEIKRELSKGQNFNQMLDAVKASGLSIHKIGEILALEFKEIET